MFSCDFMEISIDYMTEILSLRLYGTMCTQVEIELPVPDTLPTSAESFRSNSNTWLELYFESIHVEMYCKSQQGSLEETMSVGFTSSFELRQQMIQNVEQFSGYQGGDPHKHKELEQVIEKFMKKFFMPHENAKRRKDITISSKMIQRTCKTYGVGSNAW
uniref:Uncharacterized protein n=1 Tax=Cucumis melo TaxID=3656 RepID=A0A9I9EA19_CUCME